MIVRVNALLTVPSSVRPPVTIDERDRKDYFTPSCSLFRDYCECVIDRYGLRRDLIQQERVEDIDFGSVPGVSETEQVFTVRSDQGIHHARSLVLAVGPGNAPSIPAGLGETGQGCCHAMQIREFPDPSVADKLRQNKDVNIVVVGGGLTSAQLTVMASKHGARKVFHLVRGRLRVKPFDVDLNWMGKFRNFEEASFWSADTDEGKHTCHHHEVCTNAHQSVLKRSKKLVVEDRLLPDTTSCSSNIPLPAKLHYTPKRQLHPQSSPTSHGHLRQAHLLSCQASTMSTLQQAFPVTSKVCHFCKPSIASFLSSRMAVFLA
jgi:hypothetical protein